MVATSPLRSGQEMRRMAEGFIVWRLLGQRPFLRSFCATRAFTNFFRRAADGGLSGAKRMVPFEVWKFLSSFLNSTVGPAPGNRLQWSENAAKLASIPLYLKVGMP